MPVFKKNLLIVLVKTKPFYKKFFFTKVRPKVIVYAESIGEVRFF